MTDITLFIHNNKKQQFELWNVHVGEKIGITI